MRKLGNLLVLLGILCITATAALAAWNFYESRQAGYSSDQIMEQIHTYNGVQDISQAENVPDPYGEHMTKQTIDGIDYVGFLSIPSLQLELPIASAFSYADLKRTPCRYFGSSKTDNLTIAGHSYKRHFGRIGTLRVGDEILLTDMDKVVTSYEVAAKEVLAANAVQDMTDGKYALTLFTCTYDGQNRVAIRCDRKQ